MTTWITSDIHFSHRAEFLWKARGFNSWEEHDNYIIKYWNDTIQKNDKVIIVGDLCFQVNTRLKYLLDNLKTGKIVLVLGNHEHKNLSKYIPRIQEFHSVLFHEPFVISHVPIHIHETMERTGEKVDFINLHGHLHNNEKIKGNRQFLGHRYFNVNIEMNNMEFYKMRDIKLDLF